MTTPTPTDSEVTERVDLLPCPKCKDCWALTVQEQQPPLLAKTVACGRCGFRAPFDTWQARASVAAPQGDTENIVSALSEARELVLAVSTLGRYDTPKYPAELRQDCADAIDFVTSKYRDVAAAPSPVASSTTQAGEHE